MKTVIYTCDQCGKRTDDFKAEKGWIYIRASGGYNLLITVTGGRNNDNKGSSVSRSAIRKELYFCKVKCLNEFLKSKKVY